MWRYALTLNTPVTNLILVVAAVSFRVTEGGVSIKECEPLESQIPTPTSGNRTISLTCEGLQSDEGAQWAVRTNDTDTGLSSFICNAQNGSCNVSNPDFQVSRPTPISSMLIILNNFQKWLGNGNVSCSSLKNVLNIYTCNASAMVPMTSSTTPQQSTRTQDPATVTSSANGSTSVSSTTTKTLTEVQTTTDGEQNGENDDGLPIAAIAGGAATFVVIIIIIIVVVVVVIRRRKSQKAASKAHADNNVLEEHVNPMYGSGDEPETAPPSNSKPSGIALRIPTDTSNSNNAATLEDADNAFDAGYSSMAFGEQQTTSPALATSPAGQSFQNTATQPGFSANFATPVVVTDADLYTAVGGMEQEQTSGPVQDHAGGYSTEAGPNSPSTTAPGGDVYAVVQQSGPRAQSTSATTTGSPNNPGDSADGAYAFVDVSRSSAPASSSSKATSGDPVSDNADNTYAVVNKSSSRGKDTGDSTSPNISYSSQQAQSGDVYAQVDKSSKRNGSTRENDGEGQNNVYAQVDKASKGNNSIPVQQTQAQEDKPKPGIKPKPAFKPKPSSNI